MDRINVKKRFEDKNLIENKKWSSKRIQLGEIENIYDEIEKIYDILKQKKDKGE